MADQLLPEPIATLPYDAKYGELSLLGLASPFQPFAVITSKELTHADRLRLNRGVEKLIEKKSLDQNDLIKEIRDIQEAYPS